MNRTQKLIFTLLFSGAYLPADIVCRPVFKHAKISSHLIFNETKISYQRDNVEIGYVEYTKVPVVPFYVIHSLYVVPQCRHKGYGTELLNSLRRRGL
jgi:ribosomal protein S18 acetylase RimI-like enzyme